jgi:hypothetical protein
MMAKVAAGIRKIISRGGSKYWADSLGTRVY